ncbi:MAG: outer membrane beta-barrel protein [Chitinophagales bacterium]
MDENLHNDPLEDFFRRSLDDFGDEPSDDVWSNLDERLTLHESGAAGEGVSPPTASGSSIVGSTFTKWIAFAAVLSFLGIFTYHVYQQNTEIANLSEHIDQQTQTIEKLNDKVDNLQYTEDRSSQDLLQKEDSKDNSIPLQNNNLQKMNSMDESGIAGSTNDTDIANPLQKEASTNSGNSFGTNDLKKKNTRKRNRIAGTKGKTDSFNGVQKDAPANTGNSFGTNDLKEKNTLEENRIAVAKGKTKTSNGLQKNAPAKMDNPLNENILKSTNTFEGSSIAATKDETGITDELQKVLPTNMGNPFEKNVLKEEDKLEDNSIAVAKDETDIIDELQKGSPENVGNSLNENVLKEEVILDKLDSNSGNTGENAKVLTEILENETPPLMTEEAKKQETTLPINNTQTKKTKEAKAKKSKTKKSKLPKTTTPKKKSSLPEGALAEKSSSKADEKVSVEIADTESLPEIPSSSDNSKWSIAASFAPSYSFRRIKNKGSKDIAKEINSREKAGFSYDVGIELAYRFQKNWSVKSGIQYRQVQQVADHRFRLDCRRRDSGPGIPQWANIFDCRAEKVRGSYGEVDLDFELQAISPIQGNDELELDVENKLNFKWLRIPVLVQHTLGNGRLKASVTGGLAANFLLNEKPAFKTKKLQDGRFEHRGVRHQKPQNAPTPNKVSKNYLEYVVGLGMSYQTTNKLQLFVEPTYSSALKPVFENQEVQTTPFSLSGNVGIRLSF